MPAALTPPPLAETHWLSSHYEVVSGLNLDENSNIESHGKRIHFVDCVFNEWSIIPNNAQISGKGTIFRGKCKFGDGVKITIDWGNVWNENIFGSACEFHGNQTNAISLWDNNIIWYAAEISWGTKVGNGNEFDSFLRTGNFVTFWNSNIIGRNAKLGNHLIFGENNTTREGSTIHGIVKMGTGNLFDPTAIYSMNEWGKDIGERWDTSENVMDRIRTTMRKIMG